MSTRMIQRFLLPLVATVVAAAGVVYYLRHEARAARGDALPELIALAPAESPYVMYADLTALRASPFLAQLSALGSARTNDPEYAEFVQATGFDYTRDLDHVLVAARPGNPEPMPVVVAEGRFDREKIASYALRSGKLEEQNGAAVYVVPSGKPGKSFSFAFLAANRITLADGHSLGSAMPANSSAGPNPAMREHIARVAGSALFVVGKADAVPDNLPLAGMRSDQFANLSRTLRWASLAVQPQADRLRVVAEGECDTADNAQQLAGSLDGMRLMGRAMLSDSHVRQRLTPQNLALLENLLRQVEVRRDDQRVRILIEFTPEMLDALKRNAPTNTLPAH